MHFLQAGNLSKIVRALFFFSAVVWLAFGVASLIRLGAWTGSQFLVMLVVAVLMFGNSAAMTWFGWLAGREPPRFLRLALCFVFISCFIADG